MYTNFSAILTVVLFDNGAVIPPTKPESARFLQFKSIRQKKI